MDLNSRINPDTRWSVQGEIEHRTNLRYYEAQGILRPSAWLPNGYSVYGEDAVSSLCFVRRAQAFGFTLAEIKQIIELAPQGV